MRPHLVVPAPPEDEVAPEPEGEPLAVLDLGAGAFRLTTVDLGPASLAGPRRAERQPVRMLEPLRTGRLDDASWGTGLGALRVLAAQGRAASGESLVSVASSWFGEVAGGRDFLAEARVRLRLRLPIELLAGEDEARLLWTSARTQAPWARGPIAVLGLGASNVHLAVGLGPLCLYAQSLPLGALRLRARHVPIEGPLDGGRARAMTDEALDVADGACKVVRGFRPSVLLLTGGIARALARTSRRLPGAVTGTLSHRDVLALGALLAGGGAAAAARWSDARDHADTLAPSAIVLAALLALLNFDEGVVVRGGLRDGVILRELASGRWGGGVPSAEPV